MTHRNREEIFGMSGDEGWPSHRVEWLSILQQFRIELETCEPKPNEENQSVLALV